MNAKERLYVWLNNATFDEQQGCSHPLDVIAVAIGCSERTVIRCVKRLECEGRIRVDRPKIRGRANTYWVDCWTPSKRCPVLSVLAGGRPEVLRRREIKAENERCRLARKTSCHPKENSRPSRAHPGKDHRFFRAGSSTALVARASRDRETQPERQPMTVLEDGTPMRLPQTDYPDLARLLDDVLTIGFWVQRSTLPWLAGEPNSEALALFWLEGNLTELETAARTARAKVQWRRRIAEAHEERERLDAAEAAQEARWNASDEENVCPTQREPRFDSSTTRTGSTASPPSAKGSGRS